MQLEKNKMCLFRNRQMYIIYNFTKHYILEQSANNQWLGITMGAPEDIY